MTGNLLLHSPTMNSRCWKYARQLWPLIVARRKIERMPSQQPGAFSPKSTAGPRFGKRMDGAINRASARRCAR